VEHFDKQDSQKFAQIMKSQTGLEPADIAALKRSGALYNAALERINADARREVGRRYGSDRPIPQASNRPRQLPPDAGPPIQRRPGKTLRMMAVEDGLFAQVEAQKQEALTKHRDTLRKQLGEDKMARLEAFVRVQIAPNVKSIDLSRPASAPPAAR